MIFDKKEIYLRSKFSGFIYEFNDKSNKIKSIFLIKNYDFEFDNQDWSQLEFDINGFDFPAKVKIFSSVLIHKDCVVLNNVDIEFGTEISYKAQARNFWELKIKEIGIENAKKLREEICLKDNSPRIVSMNHNSNIEICFYYYDLFHALQAKITKFSEAKYNSSFFFTIDSGLSRNSKTFENAKKYCEKILLKNGFQVI